MTHQRSTGLSRRHFIAGTGAAGAGLVAVGAPRGAARGREQGPRHHRHDAGAGAVQPAALRQQRHGERARGLHVRRALGHGRPGPVHPQPRGRGADARERPHLAGRAGLEDHAQARREVERRPAVHGQGRRVHLPDDHEPEGRDPLAQRLRPDQEPEGRRRPERRDRAVQALHAVPVGLAEHAHRARSTSWAARPTSTRPRSTPSRSAPAPTRSRPASPAATWSTSATRTTTAARPRSGR